uniref:hypothetical protein n=1 Tax=Neisseria sicca TaxID=490 RepID=UPI001C996646
MCIEAGEVEGLEGLEGDGVGKFGDLLLGVEGFDGEGGGGVFEEMWRGVEEVGELGEGGAGDDVGLEVLNGLEGGAEEGEV